MKSFMLNDSGDLVINQMVSDNDLLVQKCECVLGTNKKEWFANTSEGITFANILGKNVTDEAIKNEIFQGLLQVDSSFVLTRFHVETETPTRKTAASFTARNNNGETVEGVKEVAQ